MAAMLVIVLVLCLYKGLEGAVPQQRDQPQQWTEFETAINQRLAIMERQLTDKDVHIRNLETKLETHITDYSKYVNDNEKKNIEINQLKERVKILTLNVTALEQAWHVNRASLQDAANQMSRLEPDFGADGRHVNEESDETKTLSTVVSGGNTSMEFVSVQNHADDDRSVPTSDAIHKPSQINGDQTIKDRESNVRTSGDNVVPSQRHSQMRAVPYSSVVAFHSELRQRPTIRTGNIIVFNYETLDEGHGYNPGDGIYSVPEAGTYVFVWVTFADFRTHIQTLLTVNGGVRGSSFSDAQEIHDLHQATSVVVLKLDQGDHVYIKIGVYWPSNATATFHYNPNYNGASTFSGWKLT